VIYRRAIVVGMVLELAGALALAQESQDAVPQSGVVIQTETPLVLIDAVVTDKKGGYVRDLTAKDFKVWEDKKEQKITGFSFEATSSSGDKHYLILFFDNSTMDVSNQARARQAAAQFIDANAGPNHLVAIVNFGGVLQVAQNFTDDAARLKQAVAGVMFSSLAPNPGSARGLQGQLGKAASDFGARDLILALRSVAKGLGSVSGRKTLVLFSEGFPLKNEQVPEVTATLDACNKANVAIYPIDIRGLAGTTLPRPRAGLLEQKRGKGSLLGFVQRAAYLPGLSAPVSTAFFQRGGAPVGGAPGGAAGGARGGAPGGTPGGSRGGAPSGPGAGNPSTPGRGSPGTPATPGNRGGTPQPGYGQPGYGRPGYGQPGFGQQNPFDPSRGGIIPQPPDGTVANQQVLFMLADGTGGFVTHDTNDLLSGLLKIGMEQDQYYVLSYTPPPSEEGTCHSLKVKVERGGTTVRSRSGYCKSKPHDELKGSPIEKTLETRVASPGPGTIPAKVRLPFFYTAANVARVNVALEMDTQKVEFKKEKGKMHAAINVLGIAYNPDGGVAARFSDSVNVDLADKKQVEAFKKSPLHYENQFEIASGRYSLKLAFSAGGENFGKIEQALTVDPYDPGEFALSGLALSQTARATSSGLDLTAVLDDRTPLVVAGIQVIPSGSSLFQKSGTSIFYFEVYEPLLLQPEAQKTTAVAIEMKVFDRKTGEQKEDTGLMRLDLPGAGGNPVIPVGEKIPVSKLSPGAYRLELTAADTAGKQATRSADFDLE
jgi:VWFA-related protein